MSEIPNVVEITVSAKNATQAGFAEAKAGAGEAAAAMDEYALAADRAAVAQAKLDEASARLAELQGSEKATTAELTAAQDEYAVALDRASAAAVASMDAQLRLGAADLEAAGSAKVAGDAAATAGAKTEAAAAKTGAATGGLGKNLQKVGLLAGGVLAGVGYEAAKMATNFDAQMTRLGTQAGVPIPKIAGLKAGVLDLAGKVGFSPDSLAESLYHVASNMASMGATAPRMLEVVRTAAEGARTGGADLVDVTNALTAAVASGIPGVQNYQQAMGMLNATVGAGDMKMQDLAEAFGSGMVATVKGFGLSLKDVGAALAVFGDNNIRGANAGTALRMSVMALAVPAAAGKKELEGMGLSTTSLARDMRSGGLLKALQDLSTHMHKAGITAKEQGQEITTIFGKKAGSGLNVLMSQLDRLKSKYPDITKGAHDFGNAWETTQGTMKQQLAELRGSFDALMVTLGQKLLPVVQDVVKWMLAHKQTVIDLAIAAGVLAGVLTATAIVIKTVALATEAWKLATEAWAIAAKLAAAAQWLLNLAMDANPIGLIVIAVGALVIAFVELWKHSAAFRNFWKAVWHDVLVVIHDVWNWIKSNWPYLLGILLGPVGMAAAIIYKHFDTIKHWAAEAVDWIKSHWQLLVEILTGPIGIATLWIIDHWNQIVNGVASMIGAITTWFQALPGRILSAIGDLAGLLFRVGVNAIQGLLNGIGSMVGGAISTVEGWGHDIASAFTNPFGIHLSEPSEAAIMVRAGRNIPRGLGKGMLAGLPELAAVAGRVGGAAMPYGGYGRGFGYGAPGGVLQLQVSLAPGLHPGLAAELLRIMRFEVRTKGGGDVQAALGSS